MLNLNKNKHSPVEISPFDQSILLTLLFNANDWTDIEKLRQLEIIS